MKSKKLPTQGTLIGGEVREEINNDSYVSMMQGLAGLNGSNGIGARGAAGMTSPTARRMMARVAAGMIPINAMLLNEQSGIGHRICAEPVAAAMLAGYAVIADTPAQQKAVEDLFEDLNVWRTVGTAAVHRRSSGWSVIVFGDEFVRPHPSYRITPSTDWFNDYRSPLFGLPEGWQIELKAPIGGDVYIPQQDSFLMGDKDHDPIYQISGTEFGTPVLGRVFAALERLGLSHELILSILSMSIQDIYKRNDLDEDLDKPGGERKVARRIGGIAATRMLNDMVVIDGEEEITRLQSSMTNQADMMDVAIRVVSMESGIPVSVLANSKAGLSNSDSSGDDVWLRLVEAENTFHIIPAFKAIARHYLGIRADFVPNKSQGDIKRDADADKVRAETTQIYYNMRAITSEEARATGQEYASFTTLSKNLPAQGIKPDEQDVTGAEDDEDSTL
ncbi:phage-associated protein, HI1409 family [Enterobacter cancerogenus]|uniref:Phage-associated protein, HI1409 family n=1 Tax=Enterobacter cancerogenus TaxID=69218 RepID=A0A484XNN1_9ENTR|nr:phage-associated protein, HI1409 family [Enterobacter cancerogenus]